MAAQVTRTMPVFSMLDDVRHRQTTEIDWLTGAVVREAARLGVPAPIHETLYRLVKAREANWNLHHDMATRQVKMVVARICIVGCGAIGSYAAYLARRDDVEVWAYGLDEARQAINAGVEAVGNG